MTKEDQDITPQDLFDAIKAQLESAEHDQVLMVVAGVLLECFLEYEAPDQALSESFSRISDVLSLDTFEAVLGENMTARSHAVDHFTEIGRGLAQVLAGEEDLDLVHEAAVALLTQDDPFWTGKQAKNRAPDLRFILECVMASMIFEFSAQDLCDLMIEDFISHGLPITDAVTALAGLSGARLSDAADSKTKMSAENLAIVLAEEAARHTEDSLSLESPASVVANDVVSQAGPSEKIIESLLEPVIEYFQEVGLADTTAQATALAKAAGRMLAVMASDKLGKIQASVVESTARAVLTEYATQKAV